MQAQGPTHVLRSPDRLLHALVLATLALEREFLGGAGQGLYNTVPSVYGELCKGRVE